MPSNTSTARNARIGGSLLVLLVAGCGGGVYRLAGIAPGEVASARGESGAGTGAAVVELPKASEVRVTRVNGRPSPDGTFWGSGADGRLWLELPAGAHELEVEYTRIEARGKAMVAPVRSEDARTLRFEAVPGRRYTIVLDGVGQPGWSASVRERG